MLANMVCAAVKCGIALCAIALLLLAFNFCLGPNNIEMIVMGFFHVIPKWVAQAVSITGLIVGLVFMYVDCRQQAALKQV